MKTIQATIDVEITHRIGAEVADADHVVAWICADGQVYSDSRNGFTFEVCPLCPDPDQCSHNSMSIYHAAVMFAGRTDR